MKITKFVQSCILVEADDRVALFDPGVMSEQALDSYDFTQLDDIFITHDHPDHFSIDYVKKLVAKFPNVQITSTNEVVQQLAEQGITSSSDAPNSVVFFDSPHEHVGPLGSQPEEIGIHYLDVLTHPGDSHSFTETKAILALPITAPWGSNVRAIELAIELKPKYILPIHDWHWRDEARIASYNRQEKIFADRGITFFKLETGKSIEVTV